MSKVFNEDTRVKIPATIQFLRIGYDYQSLSNADIDFETKIFSKIGIKNFTLKKTVLHLLYFHFCL